MFDELLNDLRGAKIKVNSALYSTRNELGEALKQDIKNNTPVDSGNLANSYKVDVIGDNVSVYTEVEYAPYVDNGHTTMNGKYVKGAHMYDKAMLHFDNKAEKIVDKFMDQLDQFE